MKNLLEDPDVLALYEGLKNNTYKSCDDFLTSNPVDYYNRRKEDVKINLKPSDRKIWVNGSEVSDYIESDDYGL